jgi:hypothetical protein
VSPTVLAFKKFGENIFEEKNRKIKKFFFRGEACQAVFKKKFL